MEAMRALAPVGRRRPLFLEMHPEIVLEMNMMKTLFSQERRRASVPGAEDAP